MDTEERTGKNAFAASNDVNIIIHQNAEQEQEPNMLASQLPPRRNPSSVATDQYHHKETIWRILVDIISLIICKYFSLLLIILNFNSFLVLIITLISHFVAKPFTRGFFCSDTSIQYPYKNNTIPTFAAVILSIGLPVIWVKLMNKKS